MLRYMKPIPNAEGYFASDEGEIFSKKSGNYNKMKTIIDHLGYESLVLRLLKKGKIVPANRRVNDLVAHAWLPNENNHIRSRHIDGNKKYNHVTNIEWIKSRPKAKKVSVKSVLCKAIIQATLEGKFVAEYPSMTKAEKATGVKASKISSVCLGKQIQSGGFLWFYKENFVEGKTGRKRVQCKKVRQYSGTGEFIAEFESVKEAAESVGALSSNISAVCLGKGNTCKGFIWKYVKKVKKVDPTKDWVIFDDYPKDKITKSGQVYSILTKKNKVTVSKGKYNAVRLINKDGKKVKESVAFLVASAYVPNPNNYTYILHIDGNLLNDDFKNLEWCEKDPLLTYDVPSMENLRLIPGTEDYYASIDGEIFSMKSGKLLKMKFQEDAKGYFVLTLRIEFDGQNKTTSCRVNRLVALAWLANPDNLPIVNHIDQNKKNDKVSNLEWITHKGNYEHSKNSYKHYSKHVVQASLEGEFIQEFQSMRQAEDETGIKSALICLVCQGKRRKAGEFTWFYKENFVEGKKMRKLKQCKKVRQYTKTGEFVKEFESMQDAAQEVGALTSNISAACIGTLKTCKGYIWKIVKEEKIVDETEDWVVLEEFPHDRISRDGRIYSTWGKRFKKLFDRKGYKFVSVTDKNGKERKVSVHSLVARAYIPNPLGLDFPNHINGEPSDNNVENLEWSNRHLNSQHAYDTGLHSSKKKVRQIENGKVIGRFDSMAEAAEAAGISASAISHCCVGDNGLKTAGGYKWEYDTD